MRKNSDCNAEAWNFVGDERIFFYIKLYNYFNELDLEECVLNLNFALMHFSHSSLFWNFNIISSFSVRVDKIYYKLFTFKNSILKQCQDRWKFWQHQKLVEMLRKALCSLYISVEFSFILTMLNLFLKCCELIKDVKKKQLWSGWKNVKLFCEI